MDVKIGWRMPVVVGSLGVFLFTSGVFSCLTNPPFPWVVSASVSGVGLLGVWFFLQSGASNREQRLAQSLSDETRDRLRKQKPLSVFLAIALFGLIGVPVALSFLAAWLDPLLYNATLASCLVGMAIWSVVSAFGHSTRHKILDEREQRIES